MTSVEASSRQAAADPDVLAIKQTMYRTCGDSRISGADPRGGPGKQVAALVELRARFDEERTSSGRASWRRRACTSSTGSSASRSQQDRLVVRREGTASAATPIGTGNYNPITARLYADLGLLSASGSRSGPHRAIQPPDRARRPGAIASSSSHRPALRAALCSRRIRLEEAERARWPPSSSR